MEHLCTLTFTLCIRVQDKNVDYKYKSGRFYMNRTDLNLTPIFLSIYEEKSLSKAAKRLAVTQAAVSKSLIRLRDVYNDILFSRNGREIEPTNVAHNIYPLLRQSYDNYLITIQSSSQFNPKLSNRTYSIACLNLLNYDLIPIIYEKIKSINYNVSLEVYPLFSNDIEQDMTLRKYDIILDIKRNTPKLKRKEILTYTPVALCKENHPRVKNQVSLAEFLREDHVAVSNLDLRGILLEDHFSFSLSDRKITHKTSGLLEMFPIIAKSECLCICPSTLTHIANNLYKLQPAQLNFDHQPVELSAYWHPINNMNPAHKWFRDIIELSAIKLAEINKI